MRRLVIALILALGCASCATTFTPLPYGVKITPPTPDLPKNIAGFSGTWYGNWDTGLATTLVVEKIKPPEASVIYSWGPLGTDRLGSFSHHTARIEPGKLTITIPNRGITIAFSLSDDGQNLEGEYRMSSRSFINYVTMQRQPPSSPVKTLATALPTPIPANVKVIPPAQEIPANIAVFSGIWYGTWDNGRLATLVVERIGPRSAQDAGPGMEAIAIYSWGPLKDSAGWRRYVGKIEPGKLECFDQEREVFITFLLSQDGQTLEGTWQRGKGRKYKTKMFRGP